MISFWYKCFLCIDIFLVSLWNTEQAFFHSVVLHMGTCSIPGYHFYFWNTKSVTARIKERNKLSQTQNKKKGWYRICSNRHHSPNRLQKKPKSLICLQFTVRSFPNPETGKYKYTHKMNKIYKFLTWEMRRRCDS